MPEIHLPFLITSVAVVLLIVARVYMPWAPPPAGALVRRIRQPLLGRIRMHIIPAIIGLALATLVTLLGLMPPAIIAVLMVTFFLMIAAPMTYTLTTEGIAAGRTPMRRWTEFGGVTRQRWGVRLQGVAGARQMTVWLSGSRDDDENVLLLRQLVRGAYKGPAHPALDGGTSGERPALPVAAFDHGSLAG
jgi:hypothetical protein